MAQSDGIEEQSSGHPVVGMDGVALHQGDDHEAAPERQRPDLERGLDQWCDPALCDRERDNGTQPWEAVGAGGGVAAAQ